MQIDEIVVSPLNYNGGKAKLLPQFIHLFPEKIDHFVDLFAGGCNVGVNVKASYHYYNDICIPLIQLIKYFYEIGDSERFIEMCNKVIDKIGLSKTSINGYEFYGCESSNGVASYNREKFLKLREKI